MGRYNRELGVKNPGTVYRAVVGLEKKNYIVRLKNGHRNIRLSGMVKKIGNLDEIPVIRNK